MGIIIAILIGAFVGWLAGVFMGSSHGFWFSALLGIIGGALGSWLADRLKINIGSGLLSEIIVGVAGTCVLIALCRLILGKKF